MVYAVNSSMMGVVTSNLDIAKALHAHLVNFHLTMLAVMWMTDGNTQTETGGNSDDIIIHPETDGRDEESMQ